MLNNRKVIYLFLLLCLGFTSPLVAQQQDNQRDVTAEEYERLIENTFKVNFRSYVVEQLGLNSEQITDFTPLYMEYMDRRADLADVRARLVEEHKDEMAEDDSVNDENEETADFIENYWEVDIDEMELRKDYFDRMEDVISYENAMAFFLLEEDISRSLRQAQISRMMPMLIITEGDMNNSGK